MIPKSRRCSRPTWRVRRRLKPHARTFSVLVNMPKGEPANFMTVAEFRGKFSGLSEPYLGRRRAPVGLPMRLWG